jgi:hypothetical protein
MSNMPPLKFKRRPVTKWPGRKEGPHTHRLGQQSEAAVAARTAKQIEQATPVLRDWYAFIAASKVRLP